MDVDAILPGVDFVERIESAVAAADVLLAIVGRNWVTAQDAQGRRRLDDPNDFVRLEVGAALRRGITVIPVLVGGASMPAPEELPEDLRPIARRNALVMSDLEWRSGTSRLVAALERELGPPVREREREPEPEAEPRPRPRERGRRREEDERRGVDEASPAAVLVGLAGAALLVVATALRWDALVDPPFGGGTVPHLGFVVAPASLAVAAGALYAVVWAWRGGPGPRPTGLLLGFSIGGVAKYVSLLGQRATGSALPDQTGPAVSLVVGLLGALVLAALAGYWVVTRHPPSPRRARVVGRVFAPLGAALIVVATAIPFNVSRPESRPLEQVILRRDLWEAVDPIVLAAAIVLTVLLARRTQQLVVSGALVALGLLGALLFLRYVGVPALQMLDQDDLASLRAGGFAGLAGALLVWRAGAAGRARALKQEQADEESPLRAERDTRSGPTETW